LGHARDKPRRDVRQEFLSNAALLKRHCVSDEELEILGQFAPRGVVICNRDILFILETIRWACNRKPVT